MGWTCPNPLPPWHTHGNGDPDEPCECPREPCGAVDARNVLPSCAIHLDSINGNNVQWGQSHWAGSPACTKWQARLTARDGA